MSPLVADFFADADTQADRACLPQARRRSEARVSVGDALRRRLQALAEAAPLAASRRGLWRRLRGSPRICSTQIAERWPLLGNDAERRGAGQGAGDVLRRACPPWHSASENRQRTLPRRATAGSPSARAAPAAVTSCSRQRAREAAEAAGRIYYQERVEGRAGLGPLRRQRDQRARARLQRAMGGADRARDNGAMAARRALPSFRGIWTARLTDGVERVAATLRSQWPRQRRLPGQRRGGLSPRDQSAARRHARYLRQRGGSPCSASTSRLCWSDRLPDGPLKFAGGKRLGHRLRNRTPDGVTIDGLARLDRRSP